MKKLLEAYPTIAAAIFDPKKSFVIFFALEHPDTFGHFDDTEVGKLFFPIWCRYAYVRDVIFWSTTSSDDITGWRNCHHLSWTGVQQNDGIVAKTTLKSSKSCLFLYTI